LPQQQHLEHCCTLVQCGFFCYCRCCSLMQQAALLAVACAEEEQQQLASRLTGPPSKAAQPTRSGSSTAILKWQQPQLREKLPAAVQQQSVAIQSHCSTASQIAVTALR
jgi:hypothetical protein